MRAPDAEIVWFVDRSLGRAVAHALRAIGQEVVHHDDLFAPDAADTEWLPVVGERGWALLTKDKAIRTRPIERDALMSAGVRAFFLSAGGLRGDAQVQRFVDALPGMSALASSRAGPFIAIVHAHAVELLEDKPKRRRTTT